MDCLGAAESPKDYVVAGTAANEMHGLAEAYWRPDMVKAVNLFLLLIFLFLASRGALRMRLADNALRMRSKRRFRLGSHCNHRPEGQDHHPKAESANGLATFFLQVQILKSAFYMYIARHMRANLFLLRFVHMQ